MERYVQSFGGSLVVAVLLTALVFAVKAVSPGFEEWSEDTFGHAWLYMGILALAVFLLLGLARIRWNLSSQAIANWVAGSVIVSGLAIVIAAASMALLE